MQSLIVYEHATLEDLNLVAREFTKLLRAGDTIWLEGELGAGKTSFARLLIGHMMPGPPPVVPSPTFSIVQPYEGDWWRILHIDLYRIGDAREIEELGLFDDADAVRLIEWPDRLPGPFDGADFTIRFEAGDTPEERRLTIEATREPGRIAPLRRP